MLDDLLSAVRLLGAWPTAGLRSDGPTRVPERFAYRHEYFGAYPIFYCRD